ncbi:MAG: hypothetical protein JNM50_10695 [Chromatiales bacterium]|jgi:hypothetical protein|nr:hypothetical protein [Chromatiales bacterium]
MLVPIACWRDPAGELRAAAPDIASSELAAASEQRLLPMVRLAIEESLTAALAAGRPLPDTRDGVPPPGYPAKPGLHWLTIHINLDHLRALAAHQRGRA